MIIRLAEGPLHTLFGTFREFLYYDGQQESIALVMGQVSRGRMSSVACIRSVWPPISSTVLNVIAASKWRSPKH